MGRQRRSVPGEHEEVIVRLMREYDQPPPEHLRRERWNRQDEGFPRLRLGMSYPLRTTIDLGLAEHLAK